MILFEWVLYFVLTGIAMIISHEAAHQKVLRDKGRNADLHWENGTIVVGDHASYDGLSNKDLNWIYASGVYAGAVPIIAGMVLFHPIYALMFIPYTAWSWHDIKNMWATRK